MFGYIRPLKDELKVREFDQYKACYCSLCHTLKKEYGTFAKYILNFDFTFLAMLLWDEKENPSYTCSRCLASPIVKKTYCKQSHALEICAGYSVILAWWKLRDSVDDEKFIKSLRDRTLSLLLKRAYKKAKKRYPAFEKTVHDSLNELRLSENSDCFSLDGCADKFATITAALAAEAGEYEKQRTLQQLLYHMGRFIYIVDACDDLEADIAAGRFNAVAKRFGIKSGRMNVEDREKLRMTLMHSCNLIGASYELLTPNPWSSVISNIVYLGMPDVCTRVLNGTWHIKGDSRLNKGNGQTI